MTCLLSCFKTKDKSIGATYIRALLKPFSTNIYKLVSNIFIMASSGTIIDDNFASSEEAHGKTPLSLFEIINMSFGFMGIQMGFALQNGNMSRIFESFGVTDNLPFLWLAGPMTGLIIQPIVGYFSDRTWSPRWGRRRPYFLIGAILATISLMIMPNSPALWVAAGMFWIMDSSFNITMEPFRAVIGDKLPISQRTLGFSIQTVFIGVGAWLASQLPTLFKMIGVANIPAPGQVIPDTVKYSFYAGALGFLVCVLYTVITTKEDPPQEEIKEEGIFDGLVASFSGIAQMPKEMVQLAACQFFSWLALFHMWIYMTPAVTHYLYHSTDTKSPEYNDGANMVGSMFGTYNIVSAVVAFILPFMAKLLSRKVTHLVCLCLGGIGLLAIRFLPDPGWLPVVAIGIGFAWSSILTMPYAMLTNVLPAQRMGYFVGVFNFFIVIPQIVASLGSKFYIHLIGGDDMTAITMGGVSFILAGLLALRVQDKGE